MLSLSAQSLDDNLENKYSKINIHFNDYSTTLKPKTLLEILDYIEISASILEYCEIENGLTIEINTVNLSKVKQCKKIIQMLFPGSTVSIENIGGLNYKSYIHTIEV